MYKSDWNLRTVDAWDICLQNKVCLFFDKLLALNYINHHSPWAAGLWETKLLLFGWWGGNFPSCQPCLWTCVLIPYSYAREHKSKCITAQYPVGRQCCRNNKEVVYLHPKKHHCLNFKGLDVGGTSHLVLSIVQCNSTNFSLRLCRIRSVISL